MGERARSNAKPGCRSDGQRRGSRRHDVGGRWEHSPVSYPCNFTQARPCSDQTSQLTVPIGELPDGRHSLTVAATDAAGNSSRSHAGHLTSTTRRRIRSPHRSSVETRGDGPTVSRSAWTNPADHAAPVVRAYWKICASDGTCPSRGQHDGANIQRVAVAQGAGARRIPAARVAQDAAGNAREGSAAISAALRFDPEPPELTFEPTDITDPLRVVVNAVDRHSGVARGEIEMRAAGNV